jgi:hypothetical protein
MEICTVVTRDREEMVDITERLCSVIREKGWRQTVQEEIDGGNAFRGIFTGAVARVEALEDDDGLFQPHHTAPGRMAAWGRQQRRAH